MNLCRVPPQPVVLAFAASDPCGGAGVQADLLTLSAIDCQALTVLTALTVQDTVGVARLSPIAADWVDAQARHLLADMPVAVFKIGMLGSIDNIRAIAGILADYPTVPLVLDPVLASGRGDKLADPEMIAALRELLLPRTTILTPNTLEVRRLLAAQNADSARPPTLAECAQSLLDSGCEYLLLTGTHDDTAMVVNRLYHQRQGLVRQDAWPRLSGSYHGSGCTLASAVAGYLAKGLTVSEAVAAAQDFTWRSLAAASRPGNGQYLPDRLFRMRDRGTGGELDG